MTESNSNSHTKIKAPSYEEVEAVIQNVIATHAMPSLSVIERSFDTSQHGIVKEHFETWQKISGIDSKYNENMTSEELIALIKEREEEVQHTLSLVRSTLEATNDGILVVNNEGRIVDYNENFMKLWGLKHGMLERFGEDGSINKVKEQLVNPEEFFGQVHEINEDTEGKGVISDLHFKDGRVYERYSQPHVVGGQIVGRVWALKDVTAIRKAEATLKLRQRAIEASPNGVIIFDVMEKGHPVIYVNPAFQNITGYSSQEVLGKDASFILGNIDGDSAEKIKIAMKQLHEEKVELKNTRKNGTSYWSELHIAPVTEHITDANVTKGHFAEDDNARKVTGMLVKNYVAILSDITERKNMEEQLIHQATHDTLTNLPNRLLLTDRLRQAILYAKREQSEVAVIFMDLDNFKLINDGLGHGIGDSLLKIISARLSESNRPTDTVARIGGDEFIFIISPLHSDRDLIAVIDKIRHLVSQPIRIDEHSLQITASIGISMYPKDGYTEESLLRHADTAMYIAKEKERGSYSFFTSSMNTQASRRLMVQNNLHLALDKNEFSLHFQPLVDTKLNQIMGVEALLRWNSEELGFVSPAEFVPLAEDSGAIVKIGDWVFETACKQLKKWNDAGIEKFKMSINVSGRQLYSKTLVSDFEKILKMTGVNPTNIALEMTESILMENTEEAMIKLNDLKALGMNLSIDDFGTGYSSLSYLKNIPVSTLKIDRSFITSIDKGMNDSAITLAIISMAKSLGLNVIAEGVETQGELDFLTKQNCHQIQGYYFSKPLPAEECTQKILAYCKDAMALKDSS